MRQNYFKNAALLTGSDVVLRLAGMGLRIWLANALGGCKKDLIIFMRHDHHNIFDSCIQFHSSHILLHSAISSYPFTAPAETPAIMYFCMKI